VTGKITEILDELEKASNFIAQLENDKLILSRQVRFFVEKIDSVQKKQLALESELKLAFDQLLDSEDEPVRRAVRRLRKIVDRV
jgi:hypothetical protein